MYSKLLCCPLLEIQSIIMMHGSYDITTSQSNTQSTSYVLDVCQNANQTQWAPVHVQWNSATFRGLPCSSKNQLCSYRGVCMDFKIFGYLHGLYNQLHSVRFHKISVWSLYTVYNNIHIMVNNLSLPLKLFNIQCATYFVNQIGDWACKNWAYPHKIHMFRNLHLSRSLFMITTFCKVQLLYN